jgi:hypothetical protein
MRVVIGVYQTLNRIFSGIIQYNSQFLIALYPGKNLCFLLD